MLKWEEININVWLWVLGSLKSNVKRPVRVKAPRRVHWTVVAAVKVSIIPLALPYFFLRQASPCCVISSNVLGENEEVSSVILSRQVKHLLSLFLFLLNDKIIKWFFTWRLLFSFFFRFFCYERVFILGFSFFLFLSLMGCGERFLLQLLRNVYEGGSQLYRSDRNQTVKKLSNSRWTILYWELFFFIISIEF